MTFGTDGMSDGAERQRQCLELPADAPGLGFRLASVDELVEINDEAKRNLWGAKWSSVEALRRYVRAGTTVILCPVFRNGGPANEPESFRCYIWLYTNSSSRPMVSLVDVACERFSKLREVSSAQQLRKVARVFLDGYELAKLD